MSHTYEIEIKSLLGSEENAVGLKERMEEHNLELAKHGSHSQLNHYFDAPEDLSRLEKNILPHVSEERQDALKRVLEEGEDHSIRTRDADGTVLFIVKASIDEGTSANAVSRIEFEVEVDMSIDELDEILLDSGLEYQAKWSRDRENFTLGDIEVTIDRNAGYGYLAEFEQTTRSEDEAETVRKKLLELMDQLEVEELPQDRLERMFEHYNNNWEEYYGTDKVFTIK